ncbi:universal stress protein [Spongiactinospora sp. TRM90649]|uniref:universal stress protein n=1 Tax=Spongiactinospora sp. TRM90649 TaxID=3031114 RepID=UPI0023F96D7A|nr:universal stress protein [Spongiactinospora sp. TRM90649]MDF5754277.1 universal stress protein [Spongiactinospora sp. TRM90649]
MIIVGVDGSRAGLEAVGWAAREAALRDTPLLVAHAIPAWACEPATGRYAEVAAWMREGGQSVLNTAEERARRERPGIAVSGRLLPGDPRAALIGAAGEAELMVIGSHGLGGVRGLLLGSVAYGVAGHAACDVVVVRELPSRPRAEVVVGVDGSAHSDRVLSSAFAEAELRGAELRAVHAWNWPWEGDPRFAGDEPEYEPLSLTDILASHRARHPSVNVTEESVHDHPIRALRQAATGADLLVVGSRGHGTFAGLLIGSVSQALLHESPCPLMVIRSAT